MHASVSLLFYFLFAFYYLFKPFLSNLYQCMNIYFIHILHIHSREFYTGVLRKRKVHLCYLKYIRVLLERSAQIGVQDNYARNENRLCSWGWMGLTWRDLRSILLMDYFEFSALAMIDALCKVVKITEVSFIFFTFMIIWIENVIFEFEVFIECWRKNVVH